MSSIAMLSINTILPVKNKQQSGQSFVEFVMLMSILALLSIAVLSTFNTGLADTWQKIVSIVGGPIPGSPANVTIP